MEIHVISIICLQQFDLNILNVVFSKTIIKDGQNVTMNKNKKTSV